MFEVKLKVCGRLQKEDIQLANTGEKWIVNDKERRIILCQSPHDGPIYGGGGVGVSSFLVETCCLSSFVSFVYSLLAYLFSFITHCFFMFY